MRRPLINATPPITEPQHPLAAACKPSPAMHSRLLFVLLATWVPPSLAQYGQLELDASASSLSADGSTLNLAFAYSSWVYNFSNTATVPAGTQFRSAGGSRTYTLPASLTLRVGPPTVADIDRRGKPGLVLAGAHGQLSCILLLCTAWDVLVLTIAHHCSTAATLLTGLSAWA